MAYQVGYLTELSSLSFDEDGESMTSTFMALPYGTYQHPVYGTIEFDVQKATMAAEHVQKRSRGQDLDIDYDHKQYSGEAAGWVKGAEVRQNGLYLTVEWTKNAWEKIKSKAYRYFSPEFCDEWKHPKTGEVHKNILFGGGITNRPFLKDILPLNMSELSLAEEQAQQEGTGMDPKKLRKLLGLPEDATDEQVNEALNALPDDATITQPQAEDEGDEDDDEGDDEPEGTRQPELVGAGQYGEVIKRLSESTNPEVKALAEAMGGLVQVVNVQGQALRLADTTIRVQKLMEPVNGKALPAGVQKMLSDALAKPSTESVFALIEAINKTGHVSLGESDANTRTDSEGKDASTKLSEKIAELQKSDSKLSYADAAQMAAEQNSDLFDGHRAGSYAFVENA